MIYFLSEVLLKEEHILIIFFVSNFIFLPGWHTRRYWKIEQGHANCYPEYQTDDWSQGSPKCESYCRLDCFHCFYDISFTSQFFVAKFPSDIKQIQANSPLKLFLLKSLESLWFFDDFTGTEVNSFKFN